MNLLFEYRRCRGLFRLVSCGEGSLRLSAFEQESSGAHGDGGRLAVRVLGVIRQGFYFLRLLLAAGPEKVGRNRVSLAAVR